MKIAIISSVYEQTPPLRYGGIERVLDFLVKGLKTKGHDVTLFATGDSSSPAVRAECSNYSFAKSMQIYQ